MGRKRSKLKKPSLREERRANARAITRRLVGALLGSLPKGKTEERKAKPWARVVSGGLPSLGKRRR